jgi:hypothetical protein
MRGNFSSGQCTISSGSGTLQNVGLNEERDDLDLRVGADRQSVDTRALRKMIFETPNRFGR